MPSWESLIDAWLPAIEKKSSSEITNITERTFFNAMVWLAVSNPKIAKFSLNALSHKSGYSVSTFYRIAPGYVDFVYRSYQECARLTFLIYADHLHNRALTLQEFADFSTNFLYGAHASIPNGIVRMLWNKKGTSHAEFHDHLPMLADVMLNYLSTNGATRTISFSRDELLEAIQTLDRDILESRLDDAKEFPNSLQYKRINAMFAGFLLSHKV